MCRSLAQISAAIKAADEHDRVLISKGVYNEALLIEKSLELLGEGDKEDVLAPLSV